MKQSPIALIGLSQLFREGLQALLNQSRFAVTVKAATLGEALSSFVLSPPELVVCATAQNDDLYSLIEQLRLLKAELAGIRIILLIDVVSAENLRDAAWAGVQGVLSKNITSDVLQRSLDLIMLGQQLFPGLPNALSSRPGTALISFSHPALPPTIRHEPPAANGAAPLTKLLGAAILGTGSPRIATLSDREKQILQCLVEGASNKTIARDLQITEATVKAHIKGLLRKIRVTNRTQAAVWGLSNTAPLAEPALTVREPNQSFVSAHQAGQ